MKLHKKALITKFSIEFDTPEEIEIFKSLCYDMYQKRTRWAFDNKTKEQKLARKLFLEISLGL